MLTRQEMIDEWDVNVRSPHTSFPRKSGKNREKEKVLFI